MSRFVRFSFSRRTVLVFGLAVLFIAYCSSPLLGQGLASTASVSGFIADAQGARIAGATVTFVSPERGVTRTFKTDTSGTYSFSLLPPAVYNLKVEAPGFKTYKQNGIVLEVGQVADLNAVLPVGSVDQTIQVSGDTPLLKTENANIGSEISGTQMVEMPLNFRSAVSLLFLDASTRYNSQGLGGAAVDTADQDISIMNFGGQFFGTTGFLLDGTWNSAPAWTGVIYTPSVDVVQEFKIQTNSFSAQYGMSDGNVVNVITKSGTNKFHGDIYEFLRNNAFDANYYFNNFSGKPRTPTHMNQFGVTGGGPLYIPGIYRQREKTFFFAAYEGLRLGGASNTTTQVPTTAFKNGDLSSLLGAQIGIDALGRPILQGQIYNPFSTRQITVGGQTQFIRDPIPNNNLAPLMDPVAKNTVAFFPNPTNTNAANNYFASASAPTVTNEMNIRIDHNLSETKRLYGRFSKKWEYKVNAEPLFGASNPAGPGQINPDNRYSVVFGYNQVFSPTLTASFTAGLNRWVEGNVSQGYPFKPSSLGLPGTLDGISPIFPRISIGGYATLGNSTQMSTANNEGGFNADFTKARGTHLLSFGYMFLVSQLNGGTVPQTNFSFTSAFTSGPNPQSAADAGNAFGSFLLGAGSSGSTATSLLPANGKIYNGVYLQDDWKATSRLTLNVGLRYDIQLAPTEKHNWMAYFERNQVNPISSQAKGGPYNGQIVFNGPGNKYLYNHSYTNFSPRFGFSDQILEKFNVRGGFAIFFPTQYLGNPPTTGFSQTTTFVSSLNGGLNPSSTLSNPFPSGILPPVGNSLGGLTNIGQPVSTLFHERPSSYVEQWMLGVQYSPTPRDLLEASYVGNHGLKMVLSSLNQNQLPPAFLAMGNAALTAPVANPFYGLSAAAGSACGLANPTVPAFQLLLPMPQFCDSVLNTKANVGFSNYNALNLRYTHRVTDGLTVLATYTYAKFLDDTVGGSAFELIYPGVVRNTFDLAAEKSVDSGDIPHAAVFSYIYSLPFGRGKKFGSSFSKPVDAFLGGWQISGISSFKMGIPIAINGNLNAGSVFGGGQHANVIGNPNQIAQRGVTSWFNTSAFAAAAPGTFGNAPRYFSNLRAPGYDDTDLSVSKWFDTKDVIRTQFRVEAFNVFNHSNLGPPTNVTLGTSNFGTIVAADIARQIQLALKIYW